MSDVVLEAADLCKSFATPRGAIEVLRGTSFTLERGESLSITGQSGSGKTTLLNLIAALEQPDSGVVLWRGEPLDMSRLSALSPVRGGFMGLVFQSYTLVPELNALENVLFARRLIGRVGRVEREQAEALLERVGLAERMKQPPQKLSGGERQRVAIARALVNEPALILADEPTGNLDERTGEQVMSMLLDLCRDVSVSLLLVTHNTGFAAQTARALHLRDGKLEWVR